MKDRRWIAFSAAMTTATIGFAAHDRESVAQTESKPNAQNVITVTGCVRSTDESAVGTSGSAGGSNAGTTGTAHRSPNDTSIRFILTNVTQSGSSGEATRTRGTKSGSAPSGYRLDGDGSALTPHIGHKVEIAGTVANPGSTSADNGSVLSTAPRLKVTSVRLVASNCQ
jgi:hypothetical protein